MKQTQLRIIYPIFTHWKQITKAIQYRRNTNIHKSIVKWRNRIKANEKVNKKIKKWKEEQVNKRLKQSIWNKWKMLLQLQSVIFTFLCLFVYLFIYLFDIFIYKYINYYYNRKHFLFQNNLK